MIAGLPVFLQRDDLPVTADERHEVLRSLFVEKVICFVLAPAEANIPQACQMWIERVGIAEKTEIRFGKVPEDYIREALLVEEDAVAIFWTCAVFKREYYVFFQNTNTLPFFFEQVMRLDEMQLAARSRIDPKRCATVASHVSPAPLVQSLEVYGCNVVDASSNGVAAQMCAEGEVDVCITTETAREKFGLVQLHSFGSPEMVFFGGITEAGAEMIASAYARMQAVSAAV